MQNKMDYPREVAVKILYNINNCGSYSNISLQKKLSDNKLKDIDKSFISHIVYGIIKNLNYIDWIISKSSKTKFNKISKWIKEILRLGVYQVFFLDKVPDFAAVNECVKLSRKYSKGKADKFVNGVLRNIIRNKESILKHKFCGDDELIIKYSYPEWLVDYLKEQYTMDEIKKYLVESLTTAPTSIRVNTLKSNKEELKKSLSSDGIIFEDNNICHESMIIKDFSDITRYKAYQEGLFFIQDEAATLVVDILDPKPGEKVLDMCSAPGGKTTHIGEKLENQVGLIARDIYEHKINLIKENCKRLDLQNIKIELKDGVNFYKEDINMYDKILLDAPCSGLGILRRKPDIKWKIKSNDIESIISIQKKLILNAYKYLKPGGTLVYSTCTINKHENDGIVSYLLKEYPNAKVLKITNYNKEITIEGKYIQTFPKLNEYDGFFICKIQKN
ncbi:MAG: 16S rRNA (cytosine(967)-C(5))-methyltransferase RsmB [Eubacteriaceae bacterium]